MSRAIRQHLSTRAPDSRRRAAGRRAQTAPESADRGFVLLEEIVSITLLMIVMAALATFFITVTQSTTYERARQSAVQLANTELDSVTAVSATDLCSGRTPATESSQFAGAPPTVAAALQTTQPACGSNTAVSTLTLPMTTSAVANNITYTLTNYLGNCWVPTIASLGTACTNTVAAIAAGTPYLRAVVSATWPGNHCPQVNGAGLCTYVTSSLISASSDPTFNLCTLGAACGPAPPQLINPGNQASLVNSTVSLQLSLVAYTGVAPITWFATGLPSWLTLNTATGIITGTAPSTPAAAVTVTVTATDAFARTTQAVFTWTVVTPPTITGLTTPYTAAAGIPIAGQTLPYTCPTSSCTYTLAGAPSGIGLATTSGGVGAATQTVANTSGNLYLVGTPATSVLPSSTAYAADVASQGATNYWRLDESSGTTGADSISGSTNSPLTEQPGVGHGATGAVLTSTDAADTFDGAADGIASTTTPVVGPQTFSEEIWFRTTTTSGGKLMGFGNQTSGISNLYDRQIYMDNAGHIDFGVCGDSCPAVVSTPGTYNDGQWHQAVGTLTSSGITLYVDGQQIGTNTGVHSAYPLPAGYWRLGGDNLNGWPSQPSSSYFAGALDEASVYPTALTPAQVLQQYSDSGRVPFTVTATPQDLVTGASGVVDQAAWTVVPIALPSITGLTTPFATTAGATITSQPLPYTCATTSGSCTYTLAGAPSGIGLALTPTGIGQPSQTVLNSSGTLYAVGTVATSVAPSSTAYATDVRNQGATNYWRLDEASGATAVDSIGGNSLLEQSGVGHGVAGAILSNPDTADTFDGSTAGYAATQNQVPAPGDFSESIWFRTLTTSGGKLIGFASSNSSPSVANDRHIYMDNSGHLRFGTWANGPQVITTPGTYNDGQWHQAVGTFSVAGGGMNFYVDGVLIGNNPANIPYPQAGYWRIGGDSLASATWPGTYSSTYFQGTLDDASIYARALTAAQIQQQYADSGRVPFALTATPKDQTTGQTGLVDSAAWTVYSAPSVTGLTTPFTTAVGATITSQTLPYNCPLSACTYTLTGAPAGIGLSLTAGGAATGSVSVSATTGAVYLVGTVGAGVAPGTFNLSVTPTDTASGVSGTAVTAVWTVSTVTVSGLTNPFSTTVGATITSQALAFTCPSTACSYTVTGAPTGIGLDTDNVGAVANSVTVTGANGGTIYLRGTVASTVTPGTYTVVLTPKDTVDNVTGTPIQATWRVFAAPTVNGLVTPFTTTAGAVLVGQPLPYTCPSSSCTYTVAGAPAGVGLDTDNVGPVSNPLPVTGSTSGTIYLRGTVSASATPSSTAYTADVRSQGASNYWRLDDTSGTTGADSIGTSPLTEQAGVGHGVGGGIASNSDTASTFDGSSADGSASTTTPVAGPQTFSESVWFRTTTTSAGWIMGFANTITGISNNYDRIIYMDNGGYLHFGTCGVGCNGSPAVVSGTRPYNDGQWHQVVGTLSSAGLNFYIDGSLVGTNPAVTTAFGYGASPAYTGYWRLGGNNLAGWPGNIASQYFAGTLDDASVYPTALSAAQIQQQYADSGRVPYSVIVTPADVASGFQGTASQAAWTVDSPPVVTGLTTPFVTTAGATVANQTLPYSCPTNTCTVALTGAPAGIGISTAATGTPGLTATVTAATGGVLYLRGTVSSSASGSYAVAVTPTDTASSASGAAAQAAWTVDAPPTVTGLTSPLKTSVGATIANDNLPYTCPTANCTFTVSGAPSGIGLAPDTNTAPTSSVTVSATSGTLYLRGTISSATALGSSTVTVAAVDNLTGVSGTGVSSAWTLVAAMSVGSPGTISKAAGTSISQPITYVCPQGSCTITLNGYPTGIGMSTVQNTSAAANSTTTVTVTGSGTAYAQGKTPTGTAAVGTYSVSATIADAVSSTVTGTSGTWTITAAAVLGVSGLTTPFTTTAGAVLTSQALPYTCPTGSCTLTLAGAPAGVGLAATTNGTTSTSLAVTATSGTIYLRGTVSSSTPTSLTYPADVRTQNATDYWRLGETVSGTGADSVGSRPLTELAGVQPVASGAIAGSVDGAATFDGSSADGSASTTTSMVLAASTSYSESIWFKTTTTSGGKLLGFETAVSGTAGSSDRQLYLDNAGHVDFGTKDYNVSGGAQLSVASPATYNDGQWHEAVGTVTAGGVGTALYVDGVKVAANTSANNPVQSNSGYWRLGGGNLSGWPNQPTSNYFAGTLDEAAIYQGVALTAAQIQTQYTDASAALYPVTVTPASGGTNGTANSAAWTVYPQPAVTGLATPFVTAVGSLIANHSLTYTCPTANCTYTLAGTPSGIGLSTAATGTTGSSVTVAATTGIIYLRGTVSTATSAGSYPVTVTPADVPSGVVGTPLSSTWSVQATPGTTAYANDVTGQASNYWRLGESTGSSGLDSVGSLPLTEQAGVGHGATGAILTNPANNASTFDGSSTDGSASTTTAYYAAPTTNLSVSIWFKTTTTSGGKLIGFESSQTGLGTSADRQIYMDNAGHLTYSLNSTYPAGVNALTTSGTYNDGQWHEAVATLSSSGMALYVDGQLVQSNPAVTGGAVYYQGFWRLGGGAVLSGNPGILSSTYFAGTLDEAAVYPSALSLAQVQQQFLDSGRTP